MILRDRSEAWLYADLEEHVRNLPKGDNAKVKLLPPQGALGRPGTLSP